MSALSERPTVVILGASNMTRGLGALRTLLGRAVPGRPIEVLAALGMGRSYGLTSNVIGRRLPSVLECGLWRALDERPRPELLAFVTDVGNDLLYGQDVGTILAWVDECTARLHARGARLVLTSLPPAVAEISRARFLLLRSALFPRSTLRFESLPHALPALDAGLRQVAARYGAAFVELRRDWYGFDPIHVRLRAYPDAFTEIVSAAAAVDSLPRVPVSRTLRTFALLAERQWIFGREIRRRQPCLREAGGTTVSLY